MQTTHTFGGRSTQERKSTNSSLVYLVLQATTSSCCLMPFLTLSNDFYLGTIPKYENLLTLFSITQSVINVYNSLTMLNVTTQLRQINYVKLLKHIGVHKHVESTTQLNKLIIMSSFWKVKWCTMTLTIPSTPVIFNEYRLLSNVDFEHLI